MGRVTKPKDDHIVLNIQNQPPVFECRGCGAQKTLELPVLITVVVKRSRAFIKQHLQCAAKIGPPSV